MTMTDGWTNVGDYEARTRTGAERARRVRMSNDEAGKANQGASVRLNPSDFPGGTAHRRSVLDRRRGLRLVSSQGAGTLGGRLSRL